ELQALALDVRVLDRDGREIELSEISDDGDGPEVVSDVSESDVGEAVEPDDYSASSGEDEMEEEDDDSFDFDIGDAGFGIEDDLSSDDDDDSEYI
ncbi:MAG TPA: hypothetical protein PKZ58_07550, partial [Bacillota bacterium]|nr:hypothetical protein [Bacillota bacterium]